MYTRTLKLAVLAAFAGIAAQAQATDITLVDQASVTVHPYFRSSCWNTSLIPAKPGDWVFFGGVGPGTQFTWTGFEALLNPKCKHPTMRFTFTLDGEPDPVGHADKTRTTKMDLDGSVPVYTLTASDVVTVTRVLSSVTPAPDADGDDD